MNATSSRSYWATLFALLLCVSNVSRLAAEEDDEPTVPVPTAGDASADDADSPDASSDGAKTGEPAASDESTAGSNSAGSAEPAHNDAESATSESGTAEPTVADTDSQPGAMPPKSKYDSAGDDDHRAVADSDVDQRPSLRPAERRFTIEAASFKGIQPGKSTAAELAEGWGAPKEIRKQNGRKTQIYKIEVFPRVTVTLAENVVISIVVNLDKPMSPEELATQLSIDDISSVQITDDKGQLLGEAFPERGVMFGYAPKSAKPRVSQVVLEPIDPAPFLLRAETYLHADYARCLADADAALAIDPKSAQAHGLRARVYFKAGDLAQALAAAQAATDLEPNEPEWNLLVARILIEGADFKRAQEQIRSVLGAKNTPALTKARAHSLLGDCLTLVAGGNEQAMKHHLEAIKLAESLVTSTRVTVRRGAKEVMLSAHLGAAGDVGWGHWQQKSQAIARWVERAETFAKDLVQHEQAEEDLLLQVDVAAMAALAGVAEPPDASQWVKSYVARAGRLIEQSTDTARQSQLEWQLGRALSDMAGIELARGHHQKSLEYGQLALDHLQTGDAAGRQLPYHDFLLGQLLYKLGATAAIGEKNHESAVEWYGRAVTLLEKPVPPSRLTDPGRYGETFVSIAVSYWEVGRRDEALRLTTQGIKLMEQAIEDGLMAKSVLAVPYGNLASMHAELGDKQLAAEFAELSAKCEKTKR